MCWPPVYVANQSHTTADTIVVNWHPPEEDIEDEEFHVAGLAHYICLQPDVNLWREEGEGGVSY